MNTEIIFFREIRALAGLAAKPPAVFLPSEETAEQLFGFVTVHIGPLAPTAKLSYGRASNAYPGFSFSLVFIMEAGLAAAGPVAGHVWMIDLPSLSRVTTNASGVSRRM
jgi:phage tail protein X